MFHIGWRSACRTLPRPRRERGPVHGRRCDVRPSCSASAANGKRAGVDSGRTPQRATLRQPKSSWQASRLPCYPVQAGRLSRLVMSCGAVDACFSQGGTPALQPTRMRQIQVNGVYRIELIGSVVHTPIGFEDLAPNATSPDRISTRHAHRLLGVRLVPRRMAPNAVGRTVERLHDPIGPDDGYGAGL